MQSNFFSVPGPSACKASETFISIRLIATTNEKECPEHQRHKDAAAVLHKVRVKLQRERWNTQTQHADKEMTNVG